MDAHVDFGVANSDLVRRSHIIGLACALVQAKQNAGDAPNDEEVQKKLHAARDAFYHAVNAINTINTMN